MPNQKNERGAAANEPSTGSAPSAERPVQAGPPIVGIGASAGGLAAFKRFLAAMPSDAGIGFVLIPHLDPTHESLMVELLTKQTEMPVTEAADGAKVEADHVYVIPPNKFLTIDGGVLRLSSPPARQGMETAIDFFLRSLAEDQQERSIGIVLSGTGGHGSVGIKEIKLAGGMVMAQDPESADYDQMPRSAIATGVVDFVLIPEKMPEALVHYVEHPYVNRVSEASSAEDAAADQLIQVFALLRARTKYDFRHYRKKMLMRRIQRRMGLCRIEAISDYVAHLRENEQEVHALYKDLLIGVTSFFRDPEAFEIVRGRVIPDLLEARATDGEGGEVPLRIWVPGCATGEEAYSIAILVLERAAVSKARVNLQIFATDIDEDALEVARRGIYAASSLAEFPPERLKRFFVKTDDHHYQVVRHLRDSIVFAPQNLLSDSPFSRLDLISCRNLLIYLEPDVQTKVITLFHFALRDDGYLMLGPSETIGKSASQFAPISKKWRVYRRLESARRDLLDIPIVSIERRREDSTGAHADGRPRKDLADVMHKVLLEDFAPASVLVNAEFEVLCFHGPTSLYLEFPAGEPTHDLIELARQGLRTRLRAACRKALRECQAVVETEARVKRNGGYVRCTVTVQPVADSNAPAGMFLVIFQDQESGTKSGVQGAALEPVEESKLVQQLEYELTAAREDLQSTIEEFESSNEELKASNEEVMSMNEELQSTNEELETSKEEMQSLNEELNTVNQQLRDKVDELDRSHYDLTNLFTSTDIATVFLDTDLRIKQFTPSVGRLLNLIATDVGRPIRDFSAKFHDPDLLRDCRRVLEDFGRIEKEIWALPADDSFAEERVAGPLLQSLPDEPPEDAEWYIRRIFPYQTQENHVEGVVITFVNITARMHAQRKLERSERDVTKHLNILENLVGAIGGGLIVADTEGRFLQFNEAAQNIIGIGPAEIPPKEWSEYYGLYRADGTTRLRPGESPLQRAMRGETVGDEEVFIRNAERPDGVWCRVTAGPLMDDHILGGIAIFNDITEHKRALRSLQESENRLRAVLETAADAMITIDNHGIIQSFNRAAVDMFGYTDGDVIGKNVSMLMPSPHRKRHDEYIARYLETGEARIIGIGRDLQGQRKDGSTFPVHLSVSEVGHLGIFTGVLHDLTESKALQQEVVDIAAKEQERIGEDLHDGVGQELTGLGLMADGLVEKLRAPTVTQALKDAGFSDVVERFSEMAASVRKARDYVRQLSRGLVPGPVDDAGFPEAIRSLATTIDEWNDVDCAAVVDDAVQIRDPAVAVHLYRIAQEAAGNALKHSGADTIRIVLRGENGACIVEVIDNGVGINAEEGKADAGIGLRIMDHRARLIGAKLTIEPSADGGTAVRCVYHDTAPQE